MQSVIVSCHTVISSSNKKINIFTVYNMCTGQIETFCLSLLCNGQIILKMPFPQMIRKKGDVYNVRQNIKCLQGESLYKNLL